MQHVLQFQEQAISQLTKRLDKERKRQTAGDSSRISAFIMRSSYNVLIFVEIGCKWPSISVRFSFTLLCFVSDLQTAQQTIKSLQARYTEDVQQALEEERTAHQQALKELERRLSLVEVEGATERERQDVTTVLAVDIEKCVCFYLQAFMLLDLSRLQSGSYAFFHLSLTYHGGVVCNAFSYRKPPETQMTSFIDTALGKSVNVSQRVRISNCKLRKLQDV